MTLLDRIPTLSDEEVTNLLANARRLSERGDEKQQAAAAELLPALEAEDLQRRTERQERAKEKRAATRRATLRSAAA
jgi:Zn-dependent M16 (insulinase) family peptidase